MASAQFIFHAELNDFLPAAQRGMPCVVDYASHQTLKHLIEALGVPHVEIGQVLFILAVLSVISIGRSLASRTRIQWPAWSALIAPYAIGGMASYWLFERIAAF